MQYMSGVSKESPLQVATQLSFSELGREYKVPERVGIGSTAVDILLEILTAFPEIEQLFYGVYNVDRTSEEDIDFQEVKELPKPITGKFLRKMADHITSNPPLDEIDKLLDGFERYKPFYAMGIVSRIKLTDGTYAHIPMLDFGCEPTEEKLDDISKLMSSWSPGFVLNSGASFHYWGFHLLKQEEWEKFLDYCSSEPLVEWGYIAACKRRRISVLRVFSHPPAKPIEPRVVKILRPDTPL
ncbi:hypothetical protein HY387_00495 [Candidatus Daviesbacteria bacterium]|nr:hypothetical protein [Candidatus Daviesbacteria bacterium]